MSTDFQPVILWRAGSLLSVSNSAHSGGLIMSIAFDDQVFIASQQLITLRHRIMALRYKGNPIPDELRTAFIAAADELDDLMFIANATQSTDADRYDDGLFVQ